jgi:hypothetical protein
MGGTPLGPAPCGASLRSARVARALRAVLAFFVALINSINVGVCIWAPCPKFTRWVPKNARVIVLAPSMLCILRSRARGYGRSQALSLRSRG